MPVSLDCIICLTRQSLEAARFATNDESRHSEVLKQTLRLVQEKGFNTIPPLVAQEIQRIVRRETGNDDPYGGPKREFNALMLSVRDSLRKRIGKSDDPLHTAVQLAIAGNTIDYAVRADWNATLVFDAIEEAMRQPINGDVDRLIELISTSKHLLYLLDNCGEIVCDQLLIETIRRLRPELDVTAVVRGAAVLNDAVRTDAKQVGLDETTRVVDNGNDAVGTLLEQCGPEFMKHFNEADLILAKGLANFETLIEYDIEKLPKTMCFLFKAKCPFIARFAEVTLGDLVVRIRTSDGSLS